MGEDSGTNYIKYFSNGTLPELNNHYCICCHKLKNNMDIFVLTLNQTVNSSFMNSMFSTFSRGRQARNYYMSLAKEHGDHVFLCAECLKKMSMAISEESIKNMVLAKL